MEDRAMRKCFAILAAAALPLAACGEAEKSVDYYLKHLDEAREKTARCQSNGDAGVNCGNAAVAIKRNAEEQFKRERARTEKNLKNGSIWPTWNGK
ncbi:EexN family lipoprotein [Sphingobium sp. AR-3-1]|jgi:uncharacterized lipoprotein YmbA|nr:MULTISPECIES: EexN family lipoprotein [Sphingobium]MBV2148306.1 EexN family lipoprotein [Sphingobium sp. AS12]NML12441.1 EexN family lipoprotein [Sphingobium psychrophilum]|tara:strand:+ start:13442 stop:13729 length:288 start_codon:yes stop_codon:yes gene_type:complete